MSQILSLEVSDDVFVAIQCEAEAAGISPAHVVTDLLEKQYRPASISKATQRKGRERFESHFGTVDLGYPTGVDNEQIDNDLANACADTHETI